MFWERCFERRCLKQENDNCKHSNGLLMPDNKVSGERQRIGGT